MDYCYDVFLSFRGVDTRKTFTEHLYKALDHAGFRTFTDDDGIERGENIGSKMQKAIQESRMSIVVLSKNYVSSRWCLEELLMILRRRRTSGHVVLPVFYDVDPSLARKQSGCIGEAFTRHEGRVEAESGERRKELMSKLEQWRAALREVADLAGMNLQNHADGHESRFIQKIIKVVGDKLSRTMLDITPYAIGIPSRAREIQFWLEDGSDDVGVAAICGMGGIGKTTLAKSLYNLNFSRFEGSSFLANVRETSKRQDGLLCLQRRLLSDILKGRKEKVYNVDEGIFKIKEALSFKRVLVVLDDVDKLDQLDAVIGMRDSLCPGSKIIITTRREPLLRDHEDCNVHMIEKLNYDESFELFSLHAFGRSHPSDEYVDYSKSVVRHSGGLPLAIKVLGSSLSGKSLELWKSQLEKLKAIPDSKILDKLKISYDSLQDNRAYQSGLLVSNSEKTNAREPSEGVCTTEGVLSLVDSTRRISSTDFDAPGNSAHHVRANQSGPIMLNSEKKDTREGLIGECLTESVLSLDDLTKRKWFPVFGATEIKAHLVSAYQSGPVVSLSENQNRGEALKRECITKSILGLEDLQQHCGGRHDDDAKSYCAIYDPGIHMPDSVARKSFEVLETLTARKQPNGGVPLLLPGRLTLEGCVQQEKSPDLPRVMQFNGVEQRVTKMPRYLGGLTALSASSSCGLIGLPDGGHIVLLDALDQSTKNIKHVATADQCSPTQSLTEKKMVRKTLNRNCRTMSVIFEEKHQRLVRRCEGATKSLGAMCMSRKHGINQVSMVELIHKQRGIHQWPFLQSAVSLPDGGHILSLLEKKIVRKTLRRKCRSTSVLSLEDHKQHVDRRWEDAAKGHGTKRISRQLVIHRLSTAKRTHKQHGIHQWPFQRSTIGLPDGGYIIPLSEKKIVRKTLKRKCRSMSVLSLVDHQQHVDRRWEDAAKNIGAKRICRQLVIHRVSIAKRICRQHGIRHRWPFERDWTTKKGYSVGDERPVVVICLSTHAELVSRLQLIDISWLGRFSPRPSALPRGGLIVGPIALSSSEFADTNNLAQRVRQDQRGSGASGSENERTREQIDPRQDQRGSGPSGADNERTRNQKDPKKIHTSITEADLLQLQGRMTKKAAAVILGVSESTVKRKWKECNMGEWDNGGGRRRVWKPPDQHGEGNTSTAREMPSHNVQTGVEGEPLGQNQEANECLRDFMGRQIALNPGSGLITVSRPPDQHGEGNTSTAREMPSHNVQTGIEGVLVGQNQEANEFRPDFTEGSIHFNTGNGFIIDSSFGWASQVNDQSILSTPYPNHDAFGFPPPQTTSLPSENMGGSIDLWNPLASHVVSDGHISGSTNSTFATCSVQAGPSQHVQGQSMHPTVYPDHNVFSQTQIVSSQEPFSEGYVFGFGNGNEHTNFVMIKAFYRDGDNTIFKFPFPVTSGIVDLKKEVSKRLNVEVDRFVVKYKDKSEDLISILCNDDLMLCLLSSLGNDEINVLVLDKVGGTPNFCEKCRSSMQTRA